MRRSAPRAVERALFLLVLAGALRIAWVELVHPDRAAGEPRIDARYAPLLPLLDTLPAGQPIGWLSDTGLDTLEGQRRFGQASYALAPRILLPDDGTAARVVLDLEHPERLPDLLARQGLRVVQATAPGPALLERSPPAASPEPH